MPLSHPRRSALSEQVIAELRNQITSGEWPVGSRIPTEPELVEQLGVARNTVREAVRALAHNGLLDIRQGSGTYVVATSELAGVMHRRFADADPRHIAELRSTLESSAAELAAERRTERDLKQLDALLVRREEAWESGDAEAFVTADATFHLAVVAASHNDVMTAMYADLGEVLRDWLREDVGEKLTPETYMDHARLVDAIRSGDAEAAATEARAIRSCAVRDGSARRTRTALPADPGRHFWWLTQAERISSQHRPVSRTVMAGSASTGAPSLSMSHQRSHSTCRLTRSVSGYGLWQYATTWEPVTVVRHSAPKSCGAAGFSASTRACGVASYGRAITRATAASTGAKRGNRRTRETSSAVLGRERVRNA